MFEIIRGCYLFLSYIFFPNLPTRYLHNAYHTCMINAYMHRAAGQGRCGYNLRRLSKSCTPLLSLLSQPWLGNYGDHFKHSWCVVSGQDSNSVVKYFTNWATNPGNRHGPVSMGCHTLTVCEWPYIAWYLRRCQTKMCRRWFTHDTPVWKLRYALNTDHTCTMYIGRKVTDLVILTVKCMTMFPMCGLGPKYNHTSLGIVMWKLVQLIIHLNQPYSNFGMLPPRGKSVFSRGVATVRLVESSDQVIICI